MEYQRVWEACDSLQRLQEARLTRAGSLSLWNRLVHRRLHCALVRWRRRVRIVSAQHEYELLLHQHRHYLLRKLVLQTHWRRVVWAFAHWRRTIRSFMQLGQRITQSQKTHLVRLAWSTWWRLMHMERLQEEAAACRCVLWTRKWDGLVQRSSTRSDCERLAGAWVAWKSWYRRERCRAWRHGVALAVRKHFAAWQQYCASIRACRERIHATASAVFASLVDDCLAQCHWRETLRTRHRADAVGRVHRLIQQCSVQVERQAFAHTLAEWQSLLVPAEQDAPHRDMTVPPPPTIRLLTFPERVSTTHRMQRPRNATTSARVYRPSWR